MNNRKSRNRKKVAVKNFVPKGIPQPKEAKQEIKPTLFERIKVKIFSVTSAIYSVVSIGGTLYSLNYFWPDVDIYVSKTLDSKKPFYSQIMVNNKSHLPIHELKPYVFIDSIYINRHGQNSFAKRTTVDLTKNVLPKLSASSEMPFYLNFSKIFGDYVQEEFSFINTHFTIYYTYLWIFHLEVTSRYICEVDSKGEAIWTKIPE